MCVCQAFERGGGGEERAAHVGKQLLQNPEEIKVDGGAGGRQKRRVLCERAVDQHITQCLHVVLTVPAGPR